MRIFTALFAAFILSACTFVEVDDPPTGTFKGELLVLWIDNADKFERGRFIYVPVPGRELTFVRHPSTDGPKEIRPEAMYTDGGSVPPAATVARGFSPWGFAPAYLIHDWVFIAKRCRTDDKATDEMQKLAGMTFRQSVEVMAETMHTLVASGRLSEAQVARDLIPFAVGGAESRQLWDKVGGCEGDQLSDGHRDRVAAILQREGLTAPPSIAGLRRMAPVIAAAPAPTGDYQVIGRFSFD